MISGEEFTEIIAAGATCGRVIFSALIYQTEGLKKPKREKTEPMNYQ
jgi:hypothetical protein